METSKVEIQALLIKSGPLQTTLQTVDTVQVINALVHDTQIIPTDIADKLDTSFGFGDSITQAYADKNCPHHDTAGPHIIPATLNN